MIFDIHHITAGLAEAALYLGLFTCCFVALGRLFERTSSTAFFARRIWNVVVVGLALIVVLEFSGLRHAVVGALPAPRAFRTWTSESEQVPAVPAPLIEDGLYAEAVMEEMATDHWFSAETPPSVTAPGGWLDDGEEPIPSLPADLSEIVVLPIDEPPADEWGAASSTGSSSTSAMEMQGEAPPTRISPPTWISLPTWISVGALLWVVGTVLVGLRHLLGCLRLLRFRRTLKPLSDEALRRRAGQIAAAVGLRRPFRVCCAESLVAPLAFGVRVPTLVLPTSFETDHDREHQDAILAHELTHLASHDALWQHAAAVVCAVLWWHPSSWYAAGRQRLAMEYAADEATMIIPGGPSHLADCLVTLGRQLSARPQLGLSMAGSGYRSTLANRVHRLLDLSRWDSDHRRRRKRGRLRNNSSMMLIFVMCFLISGWAMPTSHIPNGGDSQMSNSRGWTRSVAAAFVLGLLGPTMAAAQDDELEVEVDESAFVVDDDDRDGNEDVDVDVDDDGNIEIEVRRRREARSEVRRRDEPRGRERREERIRIERRREGEAHDHDHDHDDDHEHDVDVHHDGDHGLGDHGEHSSHIRELQRRMGQLARQLASDRAGEDRERREKLHAEIQELGRMVHQLQQQRRGSEDRRSHEVGEQQRKIQHLSVAIENLRAAGLREKAEELERLARNMRGQLERVEVRVRRSERPREEVQVRERRRVEGPARVAAPTPPRVAPVPPRAPRVNSAPAPAVRELRSEVNTIREEMREMQQMLRQLLERQRRDT